MNQTPTWFLCFQILIGIAQVVATFIIGLTFFVYRKQLFAMENQIGVARELNSNQMLFELARYMDELRNDREKVFELSEILQFEKRSSEDWDLPYRDAAERVAASFNLAGILVKIAKKASTRGAGR